MNEQQSGAVLDALVQWMEAHDKLAGWMQCFGAMMAILIAIWVPWSQQRAAARGLNAEKIDHALANIQGVFFLLTDASIWLITVSDRGNLPRKEFRDRVELEDLLERIRLWEAREDNEERVRALFLARGALLRTQKALDLEFLANKPIEPAERDLIAKGIRKIQIDILAISKQRHLAHRDRFLNQIAAIRRPIAKLGWARRTPEDLGGGA